MNNINTIANVADSSVGELSVTLDLVTAASELFSPLTDMNEPGPFDTATVYNRRHMIGSILIAAHDRLESVKSSLLEALDE